MTTADLGACEWLVWDLRRSNLVDRGKLEQIISEFVVRHPRAEPQQLADFLVERQVLSRFQADSLMNNKASGLVMGPFIVMDILGSGSMGTVYKAQSKVNGEWYAVKVLPRRSMWNIRTAKRRVRDFEQIKHPAVVPFVDVGTSGSAHYLAWPFVEGLGLNKIIELQGRLSTGDTALYGMQIAEGLDACHQKGILHALLKPANLLITNENQVRILDFGIGALLGETESESVVDTMSTANTMASSLECASPESIMDPTTVSPASDQYSLGCVLYYCLAGQYPFPGNNAVEKMMLHQTKEPQPLADLAPQTPPELIAIVERLMRKSPGDRFPSMNDVVMALRPLAMGSLVAGTAGSRQSSWAMSLGGARPPSWPSVGDNTVQPAGGGFELATPPEFEQGGSNEPTMPSIAHPTSTGRGGPPTPVGLPPLPQQEPYAQPPTPAWAQQPAGIPQPPYGPGTHSAPLPIPPSASPQMYQVPPSPPAISLGPTIILLLVVVAVVSAAASAALVWFLKK